MSPTNLVPTTMSKTSQHTHSLPVTTIEDNKISNNRQIN
jgi:hypothetical protein